MNVLDWLLKEAHIERCQKRREQDARRNNARVPGLSLYFVRDIRLLSPFTLRVYRYPDGTLVGLVYESYFQGAHNRVAEHVRAVADLVVGR